MPFGWNNSRLCPMLNHALALSKKSCKGRLTTKFFDDLLRTVHGSSSFHYLNNNKKNVYVNKFFVARREYFVYIGSIA